MCVLNEANVQVPLHDMLEVVRMRCSAARRVYGRLRSVFPNFSSELAVLDSASNYNYTDKY